MMLIYFFFFLKESFYKSTCDLFSVWSLNCRVYGHIKVLGVTLPFETVTVTVTVNVNTLHFTDWSHSLPMCVTVTKIQDSVKINFWVY